MIETLVFWALALYGAMMLVMQAVKRIQYRRDRQIHPLSLVLIVQDGEAEIEGLLRSLMVRFSMADRPTSIHIIDISNGEETGRIVHRLAMTNPGLTYERVNSEAALAERLKADCLDQLSVGYVYDLRIRGMSQDIANDLAGILR